MVIDAPMRVPGSELRAKRESAGVQIKELAAKLGHDRGTITAWEQSPALDVRRQRLYLSALRAVVRDQEEGAA